MGNKAGWFCLSDGTVDSQPEIFLLRMTDSDKLSAEAVLAEEKHQVTGLQCKLFFFPFVPKRTEGVCHCLISVCVSMRMSVPKVWVPFETV